MSRWIDYLEDLGLLEEETSAVAESIVSELQQGIFETKDWQDLSSILDRTQTAFERSEVPQDQAEDLALLAAKRAHSLPEKAGGKLDPG